MLIRFKLLIKRELSSINISNTYVYVQCGLRIGSEVTVTMTQQNMNVELDVLRVPRHPKIVIMTSSIFCRQKSERECLER